MKHDELKIKLEMCLERIQEQDDEIEVLERELNRAQSALTLLSEGLHVLGSIATVARPSEYETLFRDFAPFNNIMAAYFPQQKKERAGRRVAEK